MKKKKLFASALAIGLLCSAFGGIGFTQAKQVDVNNKLIANQVVQSGDSGGGYYGTIHWELDSEGTLTLTSVEGASFFLGAGRVPAYPDIPEEKVRKVIFGEGITNLESDRGVFSKQFRNVEEIEISDSVTSMSQGMFENCTSLKSIQFGNGMNYIPSEVCEWCSNLEVVEIPKSVTELNDNSFAYCDHLKTVIIATEGKLVCSDRVRNQNDNGPFHGCDSIQKVILTNLHIYVQLIYKYIL